MVKIIENVFPRSVFNIIKKTLHSGETPYYISNTYDNLDDPFFVNWSHSAFNRTKNSELFELLYLPFLSAMEANNIEVNELIRIRVGLTTIIENNRQNYPHIDQDCSHKVAVLYVDSSTASTHIYQERYDLEQELNSRDFFKQKLKEKKTLVQIIESKENRMIVFDGLIYHSSPRPTDIPTRIVVNYNFT